MFSGLYKIGDYVRIGSEEGIVIDMSVNYTKLKREDDTVLVISNQTILNQSGVNFRVKGEDYFVYPISVSFDLKYSKARIGLGTTLWTYTLGKPSTNLATSQAVSGSS